MVAHADPGDLELKHVEIDSQSDAPVDDVLRGRNAVQEPYGLS